MSRGSTAAFAVSVSTDTASCSHCCLGTGIHASRIQNRRLVLVGARVGAWKYVNRGGAAGTSRRLSWSLALDHVMNAPSVERRLNLSATFPTYHTHASVCTARRHTITRTQQHRFPDMSSERWALVCATSQYVENRSLAVHSGAPTTVSGQGSVASLTTRPSLHGSIVR